MKREAFAAKVQASNLPALMGKYRRLPLLRRLAKSDPDSTYSQFEILGAAASHVSPGSVSDVAEEDYQAMLVEAEGILGADEENLGPVLSALRTVRNLRPAWYAAPLYAELLAPFDVLLKKHDGYSVKEVFEFAQELERDQLVRLKRFEKLVRATGRNPSEIKSPADLWDTAFLILDDEDTIIILPHKATEVFYRALCRRLQELSAQFLTRKGEALEAFVERRLRVLAPAWNYETGGLVAGREKDFVAWDDQSGLAVECKCLRLRPTSTEWSALNLAEDLTTVRAAMQQADASLTLLKEGGTTPSGTHLRGNRQVHALIITDEPYSGYFRMGVDGLSPEALDAGAPWHGNQVWIASFLDLNYAVRICQSVSVLLHYLQTHRSQTWRRGDDEPECLSAYGSVTAQALGEVGVIETVQEADWERRREIGIESYRPQWLRRTDLVRELDGRGQSKLAMRIIQQDLEEARRRYRKQVAKRDEPRSPEEDAETVAMIEKIRGDVETRRQNTRLDEPSSYRSL